MVEIWLSFNNREDVLQLPVTPMYRLECGANNQVVNLHETGDVNLPGTPSLREMTISSFFPAAGKNYYFSKYEDVPDPLDAVALIEKWRTSRRPIRVIITERDINFAALIESFSYGDDDQSGDVYFDLKLKEYIFLEAPTLATADATTTETAKAKEHADKKEWKIRYGDTLTGIALSVFGDSAKWKDIYEWNKDLIKNPGSLKAIEGQVLKLVKPKEK